jgi:hypothetical protein
MALSAATPAFASSIVCSTKSFFTPPAFAAVNALTQSMLPCPTATCFPDASARAARLRLHGFRAKAQTRACDRDSEPHITGDSCVHDGSPSHRGGIAANVSSMFSSTASVDLTPASMSRSPNAAVEGRASPHVPDFVAA